MNVEIKKLTGQIYLALGIIILAILVLFWLFSRSFATIKLAPRNAIVSIDGDQLRVNNSGIAKKTISPGSHLVKVEASGYMGVSIEIDFNRGFSKAVEITLKELPEPLQIGEGGKLLSKGNDFNTSYYLGDSGKTLYRMRANLDENSKIKIIENQRITDPVLSDVKEIIWSPTKELALLRKSDRITLFDFKKYDFINQTELPWGKNIGDIAWAPDNSKIAYYYAPENGEKSLIFSNIANTEVTRISNLKELQIENPILRWSPDSEWLLIIPRNKDYSQNKIYLLNAYSQSLSTIADTGSQIDAIFSPDSNKILFSTYSQDPANPISSVLSIMKRDGSEKRLLDVRADLKKVSWSQDSRHAVIATYDPSNQRESIYRYDTQEKKMAGFYINNIGDIYIKALTISDDNKIVFYETSNGVYALKVE